MTTTMALGIDLGDKTSHACLIDDVGVPVLRDRIRTTPEAMRSFFAPFAAATNKPVVVMESGTHSRWVSELVTELGLEVVVANPSHVRLIYASKTKTDRFDAEALASCRESVGIVRASDFDHRPGNDETEVQMFDNSNRSLLIRLLITIGLIAVSVAFCSGAA